MDLLRKYRGWLLPVLLATSLLAVLVLGLSFASAQTTTPEATDTTTSTPSSGMTSIVTGTATSASTGTVTATAEVSGTSTSVATTGPGATSTTGPGTTSTPTSAAEATRTPTPGTAGTRTPTPAATITASLQISLPTQSYLTLELALQAANAALKECEGQGYPVAVTIVDQSGVEKLVLKGDGAGPATLGSSFQKAFTSAALGSSTRGLVDRVQKDPTLAGIADMDDRLILLAGGLPIRVNSQVVGGIGVGGASSGLIDETCAQAGLDSLAED